MSFKKTLGRLVALLIIGSALIFGMSGIYHEAPWIVAPLFGSTKIEFAGKYLDSDTPGVKAKINKRDLAQLDYLPNLKSADFRGSSCYQEIAQWAEAHPDVEVIYSVPLPNGTIVDSNTEELDLSQLTNADTDAMRDALSYLHNIRALNFGEVGGERFSLENMKNIQLDVPNARLHFSAVIDGQVFDGDAQSLDLRDARPENVQELSAMLACMPNLQVVELGSEETGKIPWDGIATMKRDCKNVQFRYSFTLYGRQMDLDAEKLDYRGIRITDNGDALYKALSCMNHCTYVDMDSTGVSYESLEQMRELFPQTKIVWRVWFGDNYSVRTDVEKILASKPSVGGMIYDASVLKYCTDIKYLDLGHNDDLADLSFVSSMPNLEVLIIAMTAITDISPLRNCPKLEYVELNSTNIADLSPLENCTGLHHLNIAGCPKIKDITPLYGLTELERLWIGRDTPVPAEQAQRMKELVPGCKVNTTTDDPHGDAWRFTRYDPEEPKYYWVPRYELLREQMGYNYQEYSFYWLDPLCDKEAPDEYVGMFGKEVYGLA